MVTNALPNHKTGAFPRKGNLNAISAQNITYIYLVNPKYTVKPKWSRELGVALNGVKFEPGTAAFAEFDTDETSIYLDGSNVVIEATGNPNHTTVYWGSGHPLYIEEPDVQLTPSIIPNFDGSGTLTVSTSPQLANSSTATQLGAIGIAVSGAAIYNDQEGNGALDGAAVSLDYTGGHIGPGQYH